jgi:hypothetical protein
LAARGIKADRGDSAASVSRLDGAGFPYQAERQGQIALLARHNVFAPAGLAADRWSGSGPIREVFKRAFGLAGLPYFNPHSFRDMLVRHAMKLDLTPEAMKAWSQNLGHFDVLTTFTSYGHVPASRQGELIRAAAGQAKQADLFRDEDLAGLLQALAARLSGGTRSRRDADPKI